MLPLALLVDSARALPCFASYQIRILLDSSPEVIWGDGRDALMLVNKKDAGPVLTLHEFPVISSVRLCLTHFAFQ